MGPLACSEETNLFVVTSLSSMLHLYRRKEATQQHVLDLGVLSLVVAQPQYDRFAIHPAQS